MAYRFPTLVASDTTDFVALKDVQAQTAEGYKQAFLQQIFNQGLFRKVPKEEACRIQGFPSHFQLPESRSRWMELIGNSISVPVISTLIAAIVETGCFEDIDTSIAPRYDSTIDNQKNAYKSEVLTKSIPRMRLGMQK